MIPACPWCGATLRVGNALPGVPCLLLARSRCGACETDWLIAHRVALADGRIAVTVVGAAQLLECSQPAVLAAVATLGLTKEEQQLIAAFGESGEVAA